MRCQECKQLMPGALYGELEPEDGLRMQSHLDECSACTATYAGMHSTLAVMNRREVADPGQAYWDGFFNRVSARLERGGAEKVWWRRIWSGAGSVRLTWTYGAAAAVLLLAAGMFAGRVFFPEQVMVARPQYREKATTPIDVMPASVNDRAMDYIDDSQVLLLALVNYEPEEAGTFGPADFSQQKQRSRELVNRAAGLQDELSDPGQRRLRELVADLEMILLQIANLETDEDDSAVELIRSSVDRQSLLLKINLHKMREDVDEETRGSGGSKRGAHNGNRSI